jgi:SAM-dependent methyltransferase
MTHSPIHSEDNFDKRETIYHDLHSVQLESQEQQNRISAEKIFNLLFKLYKPNSILDVGCGLGTWLSVARELGVENVYGIEGPWINLKQLRIDPEDFTIQDLEHPFNLHRSFDLVISLEVAEHLSPKVASTFIASLVSHGDIILFSAAIPYQGGHNHINEQFPSYWANLFAQFGFIPLDFIRRNIWDDRNIHWWLRQNILLFIRREIAIKNSIFARYIDSMKPLSIVHPDVYISLLQLFEQTIRQYSQFLNNFSQEGIYTIESKNGQLIISEVNKRI